MSQDIPSENVNAKVVDSEKKKKDTITKPSTLVQENELVDKNSSDNSPVALNEIKIVKKQLVKNQLWKLIRGKFLITFYLCQECQNNLFYSQDKFCENSSGVTVKIGLCHKCVEANSKATDVLAPYKKIGSKRKAD
uniref:Uncharacterized protein n=2 Tax=Meloidogyne TaxID=189290 RepID=A0A6V7U7T2_MELEN|nr:unnamed protein product [Meloidogyne enterolobii]